MPQRELHIAHALTRCFFWYRSNVFADELVRESLDNSQRDECSMQGALKCKVLVQLAGKDEIAPAATVLKHVQEHNAQVRSRFPPSRSHLHKRAQVRKQRLRDRKSVV